MESYLNIYMYGKSYTYAVNYEGNPADVNTT